MRGGQPDLPVDDDDIETIDDWRDATNEFLYKMYSMRFLCEIDPTSGSRFRDLKEAFSGSPSTIGDRKNRAAELYLIKPDVRKTEDGYGTHTYWVLTRVGEHIRHELQRRQIPSLHSELKVLERQMKNHRDDVEDYGLEMVNDAFTILYQDKE